MKYFLTLLFKLTKYFTFWNVLLHLVIPWSMMHILTKTAIFVSIVGTFVLVHNHFLRQRGKLWLILTVHLCHIVPLLLHVRYFFRENGCIIFDFTVDGLRGTLFLISMLALYTIFTLVVHRTNPFLIYYDVMNNNMKR